MKLRSAKSDLSASSYSALEMPKFLKAGDVVRLGIDGLGEQQQKIVRFQT